MLNNYKMKFTELWGELYIPITSEEIERSWGPLYKPLTPEEIKETLKSMTDWDIKVTLQKSEIRCNCGYKGPAKILDKGHGYCIYKCQKCKEKPRVLDGGEIKIIGIN